VVYNILIFSIGIAAFLFTDSLLKGIKRAAGDEKDNIYRVFEANQEQSYIQIQTGFIPDSLIRSRLFLPVESTFSFNIFPGDIDNGNSEKTGIRVLECNDDLFNLFLDYNSINLNSDDDNIILISEKISTALFEKNKNIKFFVAEPTGSEIYLNGIKFTIGGIIDGDSFFQGIDAVIKSAGNNLEYTVTRIKKGGLNFETAGKIRNDSTAPEALQKLYKKILPEINKYAGEEYEINENQYSTTYTGGFSDVALTAYEAGPMILREHRNVVESYCRYAMLDIKNPGLVPGRDKLFFADTSVFEMFGVKIIEGRKFNPVRKEIVISESLANNIFGEEPAIGAKLILDKMTYTIVGITADLPYFSHLKFDILTDITYLKYHKNLDPVYDYSVFTYLELNDKMDFRLFNNYMQFIMQTVKHESDSRLQIFPLRREDFFRPEGSILSEVNVASLFRLIMPLFILIVVVNYVVFSISTGSTRMIEGAITRINGGNNLSVMKIFVTEPLILSLLSLPLTYILYNIMSEYLNTGFGGILVNRITFPLAEALLISLFTGLVSGFYLFYKQLAYSPAEVLKGEVRAGMKGILLRNILAFIYFGVMAAVCSIAVINYYYTQTQLKSKRTYSASTEAVINLHDGADTNSIGVINKFDKIQVLDTAPYQVAVKINSTRPLEYTREIEDSLKEAGIKYSLRFVDDYFQKIFTLSDRISGIVWFANFILFGLIFPGLMIFSGLLSDARASEIAVRKAFGANTKNIMLMMLREFAVVGLVSIAAGTIISFFLSHKLIEMIDAYAGTRTTLTLIAFLISLAVILSTALVIAYRVSSQLPVKNLRK
jgi:ABC-type antimicrobial peptide transport system permease subunit